MNHNLEELIDHIFINSFIYAVLSSPRIKEVAEKISIRPIVIKNHPLYQITEQIGQKTIHSNLNPEECQKYLSKQMLVYKQTLINTKEADFHILMNKKDQATILKKAPTKKQAPLSHNRTKHYLLEDGKPIPFLIQLGVMNAHGKVHPQKWDKFRQINRFLEMVDDIYVHLDSKKPIHIVDFGCGKAYLTFALHYYFHVLQKYPVKITGLDLKKDVIEQCQKLSEELNYNNELQFILGDIKDYNTNEPVDMMVSLHACDTATDAALEKAVKWGARVILCVPCCQHELYHQIKNQMLQPLLKHGILRERFAALATDAARAQLLEILGYETQILEFIDMEHTPKNLLIRAVKKANKETEQALNDYHQFKTSLHIAPSLERCLYPIEAK